MPMHVLPRNVAELMHAQLHMTLQALAWHLLPYLVPNTNLQATSSLCRCSLITPGMHLDDNNSIAIDSQLDEMSNAMSNFSCSRGISMQLLSTNT